MTLYQKSSDKELYIDEVANKKEACIGMSNEEAGKRMHIIADDLRSGDRKIEDIEYDCEIERERV